MSVSEIDEGTLDSFKEAMGESFPSVVETYRTSMPESFNKLHTAIMQGDAKTIQIEAHSIKSNCRQIGAHNLAVEASQLEKIGESGDLGGAQMAFNALRVGWPGVESQLVAKLEG